jgi:hypothetical protein
MSFSTDLIATARRLLLAYGENITFTRVVEGSFIPSTGDVGSGTSSSYTAYGAPMAFASDEIDGTTVIQDDMLVWVEVNTSGDIPTVGDVATISSVDYRVLTVNKSFAQGSILVYKLQVRV